TVPSGTQALQKQSTLQEKRVEKSNENLPEHDRPISTMSGYWRVAKLGKRVLRPGGKELTLKLLEAGDFAHQDVVELAPGLGLTAAEILRCRPKSYRGIDSDPNAASKVNERLNLPDAVLVADAADTGLPDNSTDVVFGEAMLTMQGEKAKTKIIQEAFRILRPGGRYIIHELGLTPDGLSPSTKQDIQRALAKAIKVNARPLTDAEWRDKLSDTGFAVRDNTLFAQMRLLQPRRIIADEGLRGAGRFVFNVLRCPAERRRVIEMRRTFIRHQDSLVAVGMIAVKPQ